MHSIQEVEFSTNLFHKQKIRFHNRLAILVGKHYAGKTTILDTLKEGFSGKSANFLVNNQRVGHADFQVMHLKDHFNLTEEIKFNKNSAFRKHFLLKINEHLLAQNKYPQVIADIKKLAMNIEKVINELFGNNLHALTNRNILLKFNVEKINLEHIISELLDIQLFDDKNQITLKETAFNQFLLRMIVFNVLKTAVDENDQQRPIIILFDNPELYTNLKTSKQLNAILQQLMQQQQFYFVLASSSVDYLTNLPHAIASLNWLLQHRIVHFHKIDSALQQGIAMHQFLLNDKYQHWSDYNHDFDRVFDADMDLPDEWKKFYRFDYRHFLNSLFLDQIVLAEINPTQQGYFTTEMDSSTQQLIGTYVLPLRSVCLLMSFFQDLALNFRLDNNLLQKRIKLKSFLSLS